MQSIPDAALSPRRESRPGAFEIIDADTAIARRRLIDSLSRIRDDAVAAPDILHIGGAASLVLASGRRLDGCGIEVIEDYLAIARGERASLFAAAPANRIRPPIGGPWRSVAAELDDVAIRLACDRAPARLFGLIFAIERARHTLFLGHPALFAARRQSGRRLAVADTLNPALTDRFAALVDAIGPAPADRVLMLAQAHSVYAVIERMVRALLAADIRAERAVPAPVGRIAR